MLHNFFSIVGEAGVGQEALKKIEQLKPDVALLDVTMPGLNGVEVTRRVMKILPRTRILILTMHADRFFAIETLKAGALGYLLKEYSFTQLTDAIKTLYQGKVFISSATSA
ncbi:response regulator transcription factor [Desulfococcaceae bacterium HSG9]|nr:response regulator transcription factor [Desulfococcaceae bacterium HSG9]